MTWLYMALAIVFEVGWATAMKLSMGFTRLGATVVMVVLYVLSVVCLALATRKLDLSLAYAMWAGSGTALVAAVGIVYLKEPATAMKLVSIGLIVIGVVGLKLSSGK